MKREDFTAARKLALVAVIASYMCIATACAGSDNTDDMYDNNTWSSSNGYVNSVTNGTDRNRNNNATDETMRTSGTYNTESTDRFLNESVNNTDYDQSDYSNNGSLIENAGDAADRTLNNAGDAANDLLDGAGNAINDATNAGTNRP